MFSQYVGFYQCEAGNNREQIKIFVVFFTFSFISYVNISGFKPYRSRELTSGPLLEQGTRGFEHPTVSRWPFCK